MKPSRIKLIKSISDAQTLWYSREYSFWKSIVFRSKELIPDVDYDKILSPGSLNSLEASELCRHVIESRANCVRRQCQSFPNAHEVLTNGKLLKHKLSYTTFTDQPRIMSQGLFDVLDIPAWNLWIYYLDGIKVRDVEFYDIILSWIPPELQDLAERVVQTSFEENNEWLTDQEAAFIFSS